MGIIFVLGHHSGGVEEANPKICNKNLVQNEEHPYQSSLLRSWEFPSQQMLERQRLTQRRRFYP